MNEALLVATVDEALSRRKNERVAIAIYSAAPPECEQVRELPVAWCRSMLEMRERLSLAEPGKLVIVTPIEDLADDLRARIYKRAVVPVDVRAVLRQRFGARDVERRVVDSPALRDALLRCTGQPVISAGVLTEEAAWGMVCREIFGLASARPEAADLLRWLVTEPPLVPALQDELAAWLRRVSGPIVDPLLALWTAGNARSAIALGLVLQVILADPTQPELAQALVRMERYTGNRPISREAAKIWGDACPISDVEAADHIVEELGIAQFVSLGRWSPRGNQQLIDDLASSLSELPTNTAFLEGKLSALRDRHWSSSSEASVLDRIVMALRLLRWLHTADPRRLNSGTVAVEPLAEWYASEGSWVDWARTRIRGGYERGPLAAAFSRLSAAVTARRETDNQRFGTALTEWNRHGAHFEKLIGVESIMSRHVASLAKENAALVIVLDGMSYAVCRELSAELTSRRWTAWSPDGLELPPAISALPSVTEYSRFSLLSGGLARGTQPAEEIAWSEHPALAAAAGKQYPPILFHKNDLAAMADPHSSVLREIADTRRRVVGCVINAIDDSLSGPVQIAPDWNLEYLAVLRPLLDEAAAAGRIVVLTSDHGHILDFGTECRRQEGSDRYRPGEPEGTGEYFLDGGRVVGQAGVTALGIEGVRYGTRPRNGYHGGITPQECLVPVLVLVQGNREIPGWQPVVEAWPNWWTPTESTTVASTQALKRTKRERQPSLFTAETDWVGVLLASEVFREQMKLARIKEDQIAAALRVLDGGNGRLLRPVFAARMNLALVRVGPVVATMQRVLNYDGYGVLSIDEAADMIVLDRPLLERQFGL
jgi:hypothetical protein